MYPSEICGQLDLRLTFTIRGLVYCQVPYTATFDVINYLDGNTHNINSTLAGLPFDRKFTQIGDTARIVDSNAAGDGYETRTVTPILDGFSITRLILPKYGLRSTATSYASNR